MRIAYNYNIPYPPHRKRFAHFLSRSIISSLWWAVAAMAFIEFKIGSVYFASWWGKSAAGVISF